MKQRSSPWIKILCYPSRTESVYSTNNDDIQIQETISTVNTSEVIFFKISLDSIISVSEITYQEAEVLEVDKKDATKITLVNDIVIFCAEPLEQVEEKIEQAEMWKLGSLLN
jgi:hypothetical protein